MTATADSRPVVPADHVQATIDGIEVVVPKGTLIIRAAEEIGIEIPRFCDHPALSPVAACRMCLIEIAGMPKPQPACAIPVGDGMEVHTQVSSQVAETAQKGVMEFLLVNHPLDCPICDKGGECPLQNQAMTAGRGESRFDGTKRTFPKPTNVSAQILLDRERCVLCQRCTRFANEIAGDAFIELLQRGAKQQIGTAEGKPFDSYFSGNVVQICPVGALTSAGYRFRARPFDLVSTPTVCEHCASGCALRTDARRGVVMRRLAGADPDVNREWSCDKGRFAFPYVDSDRLETPMVRDADGTLRVASWPEAVAVAGAGLRAAGSRVGVLTGGRLTREDAYTYAKFARVALGSDDIDFRQRAGSAEEAQFLRSEVAGAGLGVTYADLEAAPIVVLVGLEPEEESPIIFLSLRRAVARKTAIVAVAPWQSPGFAKLAAQVTRTVPGDEPEALDALTRGESGTLLRTPGAVILVGERLAETPGGLTAARRLAHDTGARLAWVPRRAGERGALDAGALPGLLPGGRPLVDAGARAEVAAAWHVEVERLPGSQGRSAEDVVAALLEQAAAEPDPDTGEVPEADVAALVIGGLQARDWPNPEEFRAAVAAADFVVHLTAHRDEMCEQADVVFPVAVDAERSGSYTDWEGRVRDFGRVFDDVAGYTDAQVLSLLAGDLGVDIGAPATVGARARRELAALGAWTEERPQLEPVEAEPVLAGPGQAVLATWRHLLDDGFLQRDEPHLAATRRAPVVRMAAVTAESFGVADGSKATVRTSAGSITLPVVVTDLPEFVVWLPANSPGSDVHTDLHAGNGALVTVEPGDGGA